MIEFLSGKIKCLLPSSVIVDVNGIGYGVDLPLTAICEMPSLGSKIDLWIFTRVREDSLKLYGFLTQAERHTFEVLINISGVGPKVALAIMSTLNVSTLKHAVEMAEPEILQVVPGIGKRTAEKILLELKTKIDKLVAPSNESISSALSLNLKDGAEKSIDSIELAEVLSIKADLNSALGNLGFKEKDIKQAIKSALSEVSGGDFSQYLKTTLHFLRGGGANGAGKSGSKAKTELLDSLF